MKRRIGIRPTVRAAVNRFVPCVTLCVAALLWPHPAGADAVSPAVPARGAGSERSTELRLGGHDMLKILGLVLMLFIGQPLYSQHHREPAGPSERTTTLLEGLGNHVHPIATKSDLAQ